MTFRRIAGLGGVLFVFLTLVATLLMADAPDPDAPSAVISGYYSQDAAQAKAAATLSALALVPFGVFTAGLLTVLRAGERDRDEGWSVVGATGVAMTFTAVLTSSGLSAAMAIGAPALQTAPALTGTLYDLQALLLLGLVELGLGLTAGGFSIAGARSRALPPSVFSLGVITALLAVLGGIVSVKSVQGSSLGVIGFIAFLMFLVWSLYVSVGMARRHPAPVADQASVPEEPPVANKPLVRDEPPIADEPPMDDEITRALTRQE